MDYYDQIIFMLVFAPLIGLCLFIVFAKKHPAHVRSLRDIISFFFWPYPPRSMLVIKDISSSIRVYYDGDYEVVRSEDKYLIKTKYGAQYVSPFDPSKVASVISMYDARAPIGYPSPMGLFVRWVLASAVMTFFFYSALVYAWTPPPKVITLSSGLKAIQPVSPNPWFAFPVTMVFILELVWFIVNCVRAGDRVIEYVSMVTLGVRPPFQEVYPEISPNSKLVPAEVLRRLGREIHDNIPEKVLETFKALVGAEDLARRVIKTLAICETYMKLPADILEEMKYVRKVGETIAALRFKAFIPRIRIPIVLLALIVGIAIGVAIGFVFGSSWAVTPTPPHNVTTSTAATSAAAAATTAYHSLTPATPPKPPPLYNTTTAAKTLTPAKPPKPP